MPSPTSFFDHIHVPWPRRLLEWDSREQMSSEMKGIMVLGPGEEGGPRKDSVDTASVIEAGREKTLIQIRAMLLTLLNDPTDWRGYHDEKGNQLHPVVVDPTLRQENFLYALALLHMGQNRFAAAAEKQTEHALHWIVSRGGGQLQSLTYDKNSNARGPDGIFLGGAHQFGLNAKKYIGLEVKTVVSDSSLSNTIGKMAKLMEAKETDFRTRSWDSAVRKMQKAEMEDAANKVHKAGSDKFATVLVVRKCSLEPMRPLHHANDMFDIILTFDVFGRLVIGESKLPSATVANRVASQLQEFTMQALRGFAAKIGAKFESLLAS